jgi:hypothetical protein
MHAEESTARDKRINISTALAGQKLRIKEVDDGIWPASFMHYDLGYFDLEQKTVRHEVVTHVSGTICYLCVRAGQIELGERGGTRTLDPMIKSHVLYRLSYALTLSIDHVSPVKRRMPPVDSDGRANVEEIMLQTALCRGWAGAGQ